MRRGDLVTVALSGDFGKLRPALVVQSDLFDELGTVTVLLVTGTIIDAPLLRHTVEPTSLNGFSKTSQVMIDKVMTVRKERVGDSFGRIDEEAMLSITRSLAAFAGIA